MIGTVFFLDFSLRLLGLRPVNLRPAIHQASIISGLEYELKASSKAPGFRGEIVTTDENGFRSKQRSGKSLIAILGDSYAFGFGVRDDQTNTAVMSKLLPEYDFINTGVNGYNIEQETLTYIYKVRDLRPLVTVLQFTPNDGDRKAFFDRDISAKEQREKKKGSFYGPRWWLRTSPLVDIARRGLAGLKGRTINWKKTEIIPIVEWSDSEMALYEEWFRRLTKEMRSEEKLLVLWPDGARRDATFNRILRLAESEGWHTLNLAPLLGHDFERLGWDAHPSATTQKIGGEAIAEALQKILGKKDIDTSNLGGNE